jgi:LPS export ABC transporter protein LptC
MKNRQQKTIIALASILFAFYFFSCTFDYGNNESSEDDLPDLIMENVDYVRVRSADPLARVQAARVERYEKQSVIKLQRFSFEQYGERGEEVNVLGNAENAIVGIESGDIFMDRGVKVEVRTEDLTLETYQLEWLDEPRTLSTGEYNEVYVYRDNGTRFTGIGLNADARRRTWEFTDRVSGIYIYEDENEEEGE